MENVTTTVEGDELVIRINLKVKGHPSVSGKTVVIASTRGNVPVADGVLGLNFYRKVK